MLGGAGTVLYGLIGVLGARIWVQARVDFSRPAVLTSAGVALVIGIADYTLTVGGLTFTGIALGTVAAVGLYPPDGGAGPLAARHRPGDATGADRGREAAVEPASPASAPRPDLTR